MKPDTSVLLKFLTKDKDRSHLNFQDEMADRLAAFLADAPDGGLSIYSGYRSPKRQSQLYNAAVKKYGSPSKARKWVAPPGKSRHGQGVAADLRFASDAVKKWAHQNAEKYGLSFRLGHEPWHVELATGPVAGRQDYPVAPAHVARGDIEEFATNDARPVTHQRQYKSRGPAYERMIYNQQLRNAPLSIEGQILKKMGVK